MSSKESRVRKHEDHQEEEGSDSDDMIGPMPVPVKKKKSMVLNVLHFKITEFSIPTPKNRRKVMMTLKLRTICPSPVMKFGKTCF